MANREYKDSLFRFLFNNPTELCVLYHAISPDTSVSAKNIHINTLDSILMDRLKNDISFLVPDRYVILLEHQSTWSPNIPLRCLWYASSLYRHIIRNKEVMYGTRLIRIPAPWFYVFYIGDEKQPSESIFRLSDAFLAPSDQLELLVTVFNITYQPSRPILQKCRLLHDYSFFVNEVETRYKKEHMPMNTAIRQSMEHCSSLGILSEFIHNHYEEVIHMVTLWYDEKEAREYWREEARKEGREEGRESTAVNMLRDSMSIPIIQKYTLLPEERIRELGRINGLL